MTFDNCFFYIKYFAKSNKPLHVCDNPLELSFVNEFTRFTVFGCIVWAIPANSTSCFKFPHSTDLVADLKGSWNLKPLHGLWKFTIFQNLKIKFRNINVPSISKISGWIYDENRLLLKTSKNITSSDLWVSNLIWDFLKKYLWMMSFFIKFWALTFCTQHF